MSGEHVSLAVNIKHNIMAIAITLLLLYAAYYGVVLLLDIYKSTRDARPADDTHRALDVETDISDFGDLPEGLGVVVVDDGDVPYVTIAPIAAEPSGQPEHMAATPIHEVEQADRRGRWEPDENGDWSIDQLRDAIETIQRDGAVPPLSDIIELWVEVGKP